MPDEKVLNQGIYFVLRFLLAFDGSELAKPVSSARQQTGDLSLASELF